MYIYLRRVTFLFQGAQGGNLTKILSPAPISFGETQLLTQIDGRGGNCGTAADDNDDK